jgi:hypothetical protein
VFPSSSKSRRAQVTADKLQAPGAIGLEDGGREGRPPSRALQRLGRSRGTDDAAGRLRSRPMSCSAMPMSYDAEDTWGLTGTGRDSLRLNRSGSPRRA